MPDKPNQDCLEDRKDDIILIKGGVTIMSTQQTHCCIQLHESNISYCEATDQSQYSTSGYLSTPRSPTDGSSRQNKQTGSCQSQMTL